MGSNFAKELSDPNLFPELDLETQLEIHLQGNHYPPVPKSMVQPCIDAIDAYYDDDYNRLIDLPEPITWKGHKTAPAHAIIEAHHLETWLPENDF
jgi:hypothetical protein